MRKYLLFMLVMFISLVWVSDKDVFTDAEEKEDIICNGVYVGEIHLGGMTKKEATEAIEQHIQMMRSKRIKLTIDDANTEVLLNDLGFKYAEYDFIDRALEVGKTGNLIKRYKELKDIEHHSLVYELEYSVEDSKIREIVERLSQEYGIPSKNATISKNDKEFLITDHVVGRKVSVDDSISKIKAFVMDNLNQEDFEIGLIVMDEIPLYTREEFEKVKDIIGTFSTTYTTSSSSRAANLYNGARLINGTVLLPGEVFSAYKLLSPYTEENGYRTAGAYSQGMVIDSIGGGVCQVSTTLYNAVLFAELEVVERSPHSMTVGYVELSRDAALAGDYKDLKFKNNTQTPIYIEAYTVDRKITFNIYGEENRSDLRVIKFESEVISTTPPPAEVVTKDKSLPEGTRKVTQAAHYGYKAKCYKIVYVDGVEVERRDINSSTYTASPAYVTIGTKKEKVKKEDNKGKASILKNIGTTESADVPKKADKKNSEESADSIISDDIPDEETTDIISNTDDIEDVFSEDE